MEHLGNSDQKQQALRYAELQLKKISRELSPEEEKEMREILSKNGNSHDLLIKIATNDIVAD